MSCGQLAELVEQLVEGVPGDDRLAVWLGDTGLPGAEPAVPDDHIRMLLAEPTEPYYLVRLIQRDPQQRGREPGRDQVLGVPGWVLIGPARDGGSGPRQFCGIVVPESHRSPPVLPSRTHVVTFSQPE